MRVWVIALLMSLAAIAGCVENSEPNDSDSHGECPADDQMMAASEAPAEESAEDEQSEAGEDSGNETASGNETVAEEPAANETVDDSEMESESMESGAHMDACPAEEVTTMAGAYLSSDVDGGEAPVEVFFQFGVTEIPQDEFLTWTLDVDADGAADSEGNGNNLEGNYTFTYANAGEFNVTFSATDGLETWNATLTITVTEPAAPEEEEGEEEPAGPTFPVIIEGTLDDSNSLFYNGDALGPHLFCSGWGTLSAATGGACAWFAVEPEWIGKTFTTGGNGDIDVWIGDACESDTAQATHVGGATGHDSGDIPEGSACFVLANYDVAGDWSVRIG